MSQLLPNAEVVVIWIAKQRFQWRVLDGERLVCMGVQASVALARTTGQAALTAARTAVFIG